jgi:hypothetical protein
LPVPQHADIPQPWEQISMQQHWRCPSLFSAETVKSIIQDQPEFQSVFVLDCRQACWAWPWFWGFQWRMARRRPPKDRRTCS